MTMKLEEAIYQLTDWLYTFGGDVGWWSRREYAEKAILGELERTKKLLEGARWRKLSEEQPTEEGYYLTWRPKIEDLCAEASVSWWSQDVDEYGWTGFDDPCITHYKPRPIVGPDKEL